MTRLFLAAGVAALAIAGAADAKPGGGHGGGGGGGNPHGGGGGPPAVQQQGGGGGGGHGGGHGGGGGFAMPQMRGGGGGGGHGHGGGGFAMPQMMGGGGGHGHGHGGGFAAPQFQAQRGGGHGGGRHFEQRFAMPRQQSVEHGRGGGRRMQAERQQQFHGNQMRQAQNRGFERQQMRAERQLQARNERQLRGNQMREAQNRAFERQQARGFEQRPFDQGFGRQQLEANGIQQAQNGFGGRNFDRQFRVNQDYANRYYGLAGERGFANGCPPGLAAKNNGCLPPGQAMKLLGAPLAAVTGYTALNAIPSQWSYLYPETQDYYYRYGDGYLYQVNRSTNLIDSLLPLIAGGYMPGQYLPQPYMASYVPDYYGFNSFYPDYGDTCNRYANGVVYQVDCYSGMVEDVIPLYASGYGVGQVLPASYAYYNVPYQYRSMYYDTPNYNYWYAPGAIYQYDPGTSMITSVAALLSPGFTVGQALPMGYDVYNVPYAYRDTYYDTPNAWYRYNNGYIYQVDPVTRLVTAIVASLLT